MLSRKILNVGNSLGLLAEKLTDEEAKSFLAVCRSELSDAADLAVEFETMPLGQAIMAGETKEARS